MVLRRGSDAESAIRAYRQLVDTSGLALRENVAVIVTAVDKEVVRTEPDPATVTSLITGLVPAARTLVPQIPGAPTPGLATSKAPADELDVAAANAEAAITRALGLLPSSDLVAQVDAAREKCRPAGAQSTLNVIPDETSHSVSLLPATLTYRVVGGIGVPQADVAGDFPAGSITAERDPADPARIVVKLTADAAGRTAKLLLSDSAHLATREIDIMVSGTPVAAKTPAPAKPTNPPSRSAPKETSVDLTPQRLVLIREIIGASPTDFPDMTNEDSKKLKEYATGKGIATVDSLVTPALYAAILEDKKSRVENLPANLDEVTVASSSEMQMIRKICQLKEIQPTPVETAKYFDPSLRRKLISYQDNHKLSIDGRMTMGIANTIVRSNTCD
jgi:hypothetical protein